MALIAVHRRLSFACDAGAVAELWRRAGDYIRLETGLEADAGTVRAFFTGAPAGMDPGLALREGLCLCEAGPGGQVPGALAPPQERLAALAPGDLAALPLAGIAELAPGYPGPEMATITLMVLAPEARGAGYGAAWVARLAGIARAGGARRLMVHVLKDNPRGRVFWERQGFVHIADRAPEWCGARRHIRQRLELGLG